MLLNTPKHAHAVAGKPTWRRLQTMLFVLLAAIAFASCKKTIEIDSPIDAIVGRDVYNSDSKANGAMIAVYADMSLGEFGVGGAAFTGLRGIALTAGLYADELSLTPNSPEDLQRYYENAMMPKTYSGNIWAMYKTIYYVNAILEGVKGSSNLSQKVRQQLTGEALFIRALCHFYLTNFYGSIPLIVMTDYSKNVNLSRVRVDEIYLQVINDLKEAQTNLDEDFLTGDLTAVTKERVRPTKWAATAMLARVYLYKKDWENALSEATKVINQSTRLSLVADLNQVFLKNSTEAIWQIQPVAAGENTKEGLAFVLPDAGPSSYSQPSFISQQLLSAFEGDDHRKQKWIRSVTAGTDVFYFPYKYKIGATGQPVTEYFMAMRLSEQYLIRAEAYAMLGQYGSAAADLDVIRKRAGLEKYNGPLEQMPMINAILHERQVELFTEWGHRFLDLKRTASLDAIMSIVAPTKGATWSSWKQYYPLPENDLFLNPMLGDQNEGY